MKILVQNKVIETTEIADIIDIEKDKTYFMNREAGFKILMLNGDSHVFKEDIPYESYPSEISETKQKWKTLMRQVVEQWESDKIEIKSFKIQ